MKRKAAVILVVLLAVLANGVAVSEQQPIAALEQTFRDLPIEARYLTGPFFWMHGDENREQLEGELTKVLEGGNGNFTAEGRPHSDWLGAGWYRDLGICLDFARRHKMAMWIYDEKWWPSGEVGGLVPQEYGCKVIKAWATSISAGNRVPLSGLDERLIAVIAGPETDRGVDGSGLIDLTDRVRSGALTWEAPAGRWKVMVFKWEFGKKRRGNVLVDGASRDAVDWYINKVYQPHYEHFKDDFGTTIQGFFYDEPETCGDFGTEVIPLLVERGVDWKKALVAWKFKLAGDDQEAAAYQYQDAKAEAWGRTLYGGLSDWCRERRVKSMGHFLEESHMLNQGRYYGNLYQLGKFGNLLVHREETQLYLNQWLCAGNIFQLMKYSDLGGIDMIAQQLLPGKRLMGTYQIGKLGSSVSHVYGKKDDLTMVEIFGNRGQDLTYPEMKWDIDHMQVRGVNFIIPHSFNPRAPYDQDCPPYFYNGGFEPRFPLYRVFADYSSRLSLLLSGGRHVAPVALLFLGNSKHVGRAITPEVMTTALQDALFDMDWMPYDVLENDVKIEGRELKLFGESYKILIVPPVEVIPYQTLARANEFFKAGGIVVGYGFLPTVSATIGKTRADILALNESIWGANPIIGLTVKKTNTAGGRSYLLPTKPTPEQIQQALTVDAGIHPTLEVVEGKTNGWVHVIHRVKDGMARFLIANQEISGPVKRLKLRLTATGEPEAWDPLRNEISSLPYKRLTADQVEVTLDLAPYQSLVIAFAPEKRDLPAFVGLDAKPTRTVSIAQVKVAAKPTPGSPEDIMSQAFWRERLWMQHQGQVTFAPKPIVANPFDGAVTIPVDLDLARVRAYVVCDAIGPEAAARVTVNGQYAGGFIERPLRLEIGRYLKQGENTIRLEPFMPTNARVEVYDR